MSIEINLSRPVKRRAAPDVIRRHLQAALNAALKGTNYLSLSKLSVNLTDYGHTAQVYLTGRVSDEYLQRFLGHLAGVLAQRFDPPWVILTGKEGEIPAASGRDEPVKIK